MKIFERLAYYNYFENAEVPTPLHETVGLFLRKKQNE